MNGQNLFCGCSAPWIVINHWAAKFERNIRASEINQVTRFVCAKCLDGIFVAKVASHLLTLFIVAAASGLRIGELLALHNDDIDVENSTVRVDESVDKTGIIGPCKNVAAYRTVVLADKEGQHAMRALKQFEKHDGLIFRSKRSGPLVENTILIQGITPVLKKLGFSKSGMHAFRRGCNRRWELARVSAAVIRQQMGHASASMTALYTSEIPVEQVAKQFQLEPNGAAVAT
jgi:integrase